MAEEKVPRKMQVTYDQQTAGSKAKAIRDMLKMYRFDWEWMLTSEMDIALSFSIDWPDQKDKTICKCGWPCLWLITYRQRRFQNS